MRFTRASAALFAACLQCGLVLEPVLAARAALGYRLFVGGDRAPSPPVARRGGDASDDGAAAVGAPLSRPRGDAAGFLGVIPEEVVHPASVEAETAKRLSSTSTMGPFDRWPTGSGFEYFYGFLYEGTTAIEPPRTLEEGYHLTQGLSERAITWVRQLKALMPDKPFFMYFPPGAAHAPHQVPKEWIEKYRGAFDDGADVLRERIPWRSRGPAARPDIGRALATALALDSTRAREAAGDGSTIGDATSAAAGQA